MRRGARGPLSGASFDSELSGARPSAHVKSARSRGHNTSILISAPCFRQPGVAVAECCTQPPRTQTCSRVLRATFRAAGTRLTTTVVPVTMRAIIKVRRWLLRGTALARSLAIAAFQNAHLRRACYTHSAAEKARRNMYNAKRTACLHRALRACARVRLCTVEWPRGSPARRSCALATTTARCAHHDCSCARSSVGISCCVRSAIRCSAPSDVRCSRFDRTFGRHSNVAPRPAHASQPPYTFTPASPQARTARAHNIVPRNGEAARDWCAV